jgi:hypothetical protein
MVASLAGVFTAEIVSGEEAAAAAETSDLVASGTESGFLFLVWIVLIIFAYIISSRPFIRLRSKHNGWAALVGVLNGFFFLAVLVPMLNLAYTLQADFDRPLANFVDLILDTLRYVLAAFSRFWQWASTYPMLLLIILTILLALTAMSLRRGARAR